MVLATEESEKGEEGIRSCKRCSHLAVCSVYRAIAPLINSFEVRKPFDVDKLAVICKEFTLLPMPTNEYRQWRERR